MARLIIITFVFLQNPAQYDRARHKQKVGGDDDHHDRHKKEHQSGDGILNGDCDIIRDCQNDNAQSRHDPVRLWRAFAHRFAVQQFNGV